MIPAERATVLSLIGLGAVFRLAWTANATALTPNINEAHNVAMSIAKTGRFANAFLDGQYTAHLSMLTPLPSASVYWLFGGDTPLAEAVLSSWSIGLVSLSIYLCWAIMCRLDAPKFARLLAVAAVSLLPIQFALEVREGRNWEMILAAVVLQWILLRLIDGNRPKGITGILVGTLFLLNPPAGLGAVAALVVTATRKDMKLAWVLGAAVVLVGTSAWAIRNQAIMGRAIPLRDNLGLEIALGNYDGALSAPDPRVEYLRRFHEIHPLFGALRRSTREHTELAYYDRLGRDAEVWIKQHPSEFVRLSIRHISEYYAPPSWSWFVFGKPGRGMMLRQLFIWLTLVTGLPALAVMSRIDRRYLVILAAIFASSLVYTVVEPNIRYRYLISSLLIFAAADGALRLYIYMQRARPDLVVPH